MEKAGLSFSWDSGSQQKHFYAISPGRWAATEKGQEPKSAIPIPASTVHYLWGLNESCLPNLFLTCKSGAASDLAGCWADRAVEVPGGAPER